MHWLQISSSDRTPVTPKPKSLLINLNNWCPVHYSEKQPESINPKKQPKTPLPIQRNHLCIKRHFPAISSNSAAFHTKKSFRRSFPAAEDCVFSTGTGRAPSATSKTGLGPQPQVPRSHGFSKIQERHLDKLQYQLHIHKWRKTWANTYLQHRGTSFLFQKDLPLGDHLHKSKCYFFCTVGRKDAVIYRKHPSENSTAKKSQQNYDVELNDNESTILKPVE